MNDLVPESESVEGFDISFSREIAIQNFNYNTKGLIRSDDAFYKVVQVLGSRNHMDLFRRDLTCTYDIQPSSGTSCLLRQVCTCIHVLYGRA